MKKAILVVSFGTSYPEADRTCIAPVEKAIADVFPDWEVHRAFTSRIIARKLLKQGIRVQNEIEALDSLRKAGYREIRIASTLIIPGEEYDLTVSSAGEIPVSAPLLMDDDDLNWMVGVLDKIAEEEGRTLILMGHGTDHEANEKYGRLMELLPENILIACAEGTYDLDRLSIPSDRVTLMPLMLVAGDHAHNDLAGDRPTSWKSRLEARGIDVKVRMQGLGALPDVQRRFVQKVRKRIP